MAKIVRLVMVAMVVVAETMLSGGPYGAHAQGQVCKGDIAALTAQCGPYVRKGGPQTEPSQSCCGVIKQTDVQCVCEHLPPGAETVLDMGKVVYVTKTCRNPLKPGTKCGSA